MPDSLTLRDYESAFQKLTLQLSYDLSPRFKRHLLGEFSQLLLNRENQLLNISYYEELWPQFQAATHMGSLEYHSPETLQALRSALVFMDGDPIFKSAHADIQSSLSRIKFSLAGTLLTLREYASFITLMNLDQLWANQDQSRSMDLDTLAFIETLISLDLPVTTRDILSRIKTDLRLELLGENRSRVLIPLVEEFRAAPNELIRLGTIYPMTLDVEERKRDRSRDLILFNNHPISQDDLVNYQAQDAVRAAREQHSLLKKPQTPRFTVMFGFPESEHQFSGSSFGLGLSLLTLCNLETETNLRRQHLLRRGTVYTGGMDLSGKVREVNSESLDSKIEAVYFSPLQRMVIPSENFARATETVKGLKKRYPRKPFELIPAADLGALIRNPDLASYRTMPLMPWVRKHFTRNRLIRYLSAFILLCFLVLVIVGVLMDGNPSSYKIEGDSVNIYNKNGVYLWQHKLDFTPRNLIEPLSKNPLYRPLQIHDFDGDGENEVAFGTSVKQHDYTGQFFYFESDGTLKWTYTQHPKLSFGGEEYTDNYAMAFFKPFKHVNAVNHEFYVRFSHMPWFPNRLVHFDIQGQVLNEFIHPGAVYDMELIDLDGNGEVEILLGCTNNNFNSAALAILPSRSFFGTTPRWKDKRTLDGGKTDSALIYIKFPRWEKYDITGGQARTHVTDVFRNSNDGFLVNVGLGSSTGSGAYIYRFDNHLNLLGVSLTDGFLSFHRRETGSGFFETFDRETWVKDMTTLDVWKKGQWTTRSGLAYRNKTTPQK